MLPGACGVGCVAERGERNHGVAAASYIEHVYVFAMLAVGASAWM